MAAINRIHNKSNLSAESNSLKLSQSANSGRKSSDHSINSIISSPPSSTAPSNPTTPTNYSNKEKNRLQESSTHLITSNEVIDLDTSPVKQSNTNHMNHVQKQKTVIKSVSQSTVVPNSIQSDSSDSDCVEIVGVFHQSPIKTSVNHNHTSEISKKHQMKEKHKLHMMGTSSSSNKTINNNNMLKDTPPPKKKKLGEPVIGSEEEIDVNKIMMDIIKLHVSRVFFNSFYSNSRIIHKFWKCQLMCL